ncbi:MAG TPA: hypothetical protein VMC42_08300 [Methanoregulaceae archaeon]|nr:hypothetical protein [Methanoregulaceae archaeon]
MKKKTGFLTLAVAMVCLAILLAGCTGTAPAGQKSGTGPSAGAQAKTPILMIPATVPGFDLEVKDTNNTTMYPDEVASAAALYKPALNSPYEGNVAYLTIYIDQFTNATTAANIFGTQNGSVSNIAGYTVKYSFDPDMGISYYSVNTTDKVIQSLALAPDNTALNQTVLKDAAEKGMEATLNNI